MQLRRPPYLPMPQVLSVFRGFHTEGVCQVCFSPDGQVNISPLRWLTKLSWAARCNVFVQQCTDGKIQQCCTESGKLSVKIYPVMSFVFLSWSNIPATRIGGQRFRALSGRFSLAISYHALHGTVRTRGRSGLPRRPPRLVRLVRRRSPPVVVSCGREFRTGTR